MKPSTRLILPILLLIPYAASAQITIQENPTSIIPPVLLPGGTFSINLQLNNQTSTGVAGYDIDVESLNALNNTPVSNDIELAGLTLTNPVLNSANSNFTGTLVLHPQAGSATQPFDLGASDLATNGTVGSGVSSLETLDFQVAPTAAAGVYKLEFFAVNGPTQGAPTISDYDGNSVGTNSGPFFSSSFTVAAVPEPSSLAFLQVALIGLLAFGSWVKRART